MSSEEKHSLLLAEDEANTREALRRYLSLRFQVDTAADGMEAIAKMRVSDYDLVLSDLRMPNADGMSVLEAVRGKANPPECVLLTAYGSVEDAVAALKKGAFDFVVKPVKLDALEKVIDAALAKRAERKLPAVPPEAPESFAAAQGIVMPGPEKENPMNRVLDIVRTVSPTRSTVLLSGESGTGKEVVARMIHDHSGRTGYFVPVHCAALSASLLESELFGYEKGAFTGAVERHKGRFEVADKGTLFLDEIGEIDAPTQVKLLRVLESRSFERVGGTETIKVDVRLIAATNRDLRKMVEEKTFREDLYYRLSVVNLHLPPLRERKGDIPNLVHAFLKEFAEENHRPDPKLDEGAMRVMQEYPWPGNIRELRNAVECMVVLNPGEELTEEDLPESMRAAPLLPVKKMPDLLPAANDVSLEDNERVLIERALEQCGGNRTRAAEKLGISRRTLLRKISAFGLK